MAKKKYAKIKEIAKKTKAIVDDAAKPPVLVRHPGGTAERKVSLNGGVEIPDAWHAMQFLGNAIDEAAPLDEDDEEGEKKVVMGVDSALRIREQLTTLWYLAHDLQKHAFTQANLLEPLIGSFKDSKRTNECTVTIDTETLDRLLAFRRGDLKDV